MVSRDVPETIVYGNSILVRMNVYISACACIHIMSITRVRKKTTEELHNTVVATAGELMTKSAYVQLARI